MSIRAFILALTMTSLGVVRVFAGEGAVIASMDEMRFQAPKERGKVELVGAKSGRAIRFQFEEGSSGDYFSSNLHGTPDWDQAAGFSFWVKGDGSDALGGIEFIYDEDYGVRYDLAFPIQDAGWTKVTVAWDDLIPVLPGPKCKPLGGPEGNTPSKLSGLWFGKWWYWRDYPAHSYTIDDIRLEPTIERDIKDYRPDGAPLKRVLEKLRNGKPVTIVTMGDSLTDYRHWANRDVSWPKLLKDQLEKSYHSEVTIVNPAIGGTQLKQNLVLMPRWLSSTTEPDLVTVFFGGNDWEAGMRGPEFVRVCSDAIDRIRRATKGKADVLILTTNPTVVNWDTTAELAEACRQAAHDRNAGLGDAAKAFHEAGKEDRNHLFAWDRVHLSPDGHKTIVDVVKTAIEDAGK